MLKAGKLVSAGLCR